MLLLCQGLHYFLLCNGLLKLDVAVARGTVFQEVRSGARFRTGDFVDKKLGGRGYRSTASHGAITHVFFLVLFRVAPSGITTIYFLFFPLSPRKVLP